MRDIGVPRKRAFLWTLGIPVLAVLLAVSVPPPAGGAEQLMLPRIGPDQLIPLRPSSSTLSIGVSGPLDCVRSSIDFRVGVPDAEVLININAGEVVQTKSTNTGAPVIFQNLPPGRAEIFVTPTKSPWVRTRVSKTAALVERQTTVVSVKVCKMCLWPGQPEPNRWCGLYP